MRRHPEMILEKEKIIQTLSFPDIIAEGDFGALLAYRFYPKTPLTQKYLVVAYRELSKDDGFMLTAYFAKSLSKRRKVLWKR